LLADREQGRVILIGAAAETHLGDVVLLLLGDDGFRRLVIERDRIALLDGERSCGADAEAETGTVAQLLPDDLSLAIDDLNRAFCARADTQAAASAEVLFYSHDLSSDGG